MRCEGRRALHSQPRLLNVLLEAGCLGASVCKETGSDFHLSLMAVRLLPFAQLGRASMGPIEAPQGGEAPLWLLKSHPLVSFAEGAQGMISSVGTQGSLEQKSH